MLDQKKSLEELLSDVRASSASASPVASMEHLSDQGVLRLYEGIRHQVDADRTAGGRYRLVGNAAKERAERLRAELIRRGVRFAEIDWR